MMTTTINEEQLHQLLGHVVVDFGATMFAPLALIGDKLGLYKRRGCGRSCAL
jgi:hypothetical protein